MYCYNETVMLGLQNNTIQDYKWNYSLGPETKIPCNTESPYISACCNESPLYIGLSWIEESTVYI